MLFKPLSYKTLKGLPSAAALLVALLVANVAGAGATDLAAVGVAGWNTLPVAFSNGDGTFKATNFGVFSFPGWAATPGVQVVTGDFNGDGKTDLALVGVAGWNTIPVAFSNGDGTFRVTNFGVFSFPGWAATPGAKVVTGDFNHDGKTDLAAVGVAGWNTIPVAFSNGDGTFRATNFGVFTFPDCAATPGVQILTGNFR